MNMAPNLLRRWLDDRVELIRDRCQFVETGDAGELFGERHHLVITGPALRGKFAQFRHLLTQIGLKLGWGGKTRQHEALTFNGQNGIVMSVLSIITRKSSSAFV